MKLLPSSLAARTVLLVIAVVAVAEFATFSLFFHNQRMAHMNQSVRLVASQVRLLQDVLPGLDGAARRRLAAAAPDQDDLQLIPDGPAVPDREPNFGFARRLAAGVSQQLGTPVSLRHAGRGRYSALWVGFTVGGERWWLLLPPPRFEPQPLPPELWLGLAAALAVLVAIAVFFVRGIVGPLARLGEAVSATGDASARKVLPEGPKEVRRLAERHNAMLARLAAADAERREMLAGLTHDLRAPLARLRVRLALLDESSERAGLARDTDDMERIVGQCLAFLHSDENSKRVATPLLIADAVSNEVARHRELGRPVEMTASDTVAACRVAIAHVNLQRLLDNLIDNALQYGAPPVVVSLSAAGPGRLRLCVRDHGPGIAPEQRERALDAFSQIEPARATGGSCGLGLAIVRRIAGGCGGELTLADAAGGGLEVRVDFPVWAGDEANPVL